MQVILVQSHVRMNYIHTGHVHASYVHAGFYLPKAMFVQSQKTFFRGGCCYSPPCFYHNLQKTPHYSAKPHSTITNQKTKMRKRFKLCRICSSENYVLSRQIRRRYICEWHALHSEEVRIISESIVVRPRYYVKCFGKLMELTEAEAMDMQPFVPVICK